MFSARAAPRHRAGRDLAFLDHFDLSSLDDLPRIEELLQVGLLNRIDVAGEDRGPADAPDDADG